MSKHTISKIPLGECGNLVVLCIRMILLRHFVPRDEVNGAQASPEFFIKHALAHQ